MPKILFDCQFGLPLCDKSPFAHAPMHYIYPSSSPGDFQSDGLSRPASSKLDTSRSDYVLDTIVPCGSIWTKAGGATIRATPTPRQTRNLRVSTVTDPRQARPCSFAFYLGSALATRSPRGFLIGAFHYELMLDNVSVRVRATW